MELHVDHVRTYIVGKYPEHVIDRATSYMLPNVWVIEKYRKGEWDGRIRYRKYDRSLKCYYFPTGFLTRVCKELDDGGFSYSLIDDREYPSVDPNYLLDTKEGKQIDLRVGKYNYQADALDAALTHGRGIIKMATGLGKTKTAAAIINSVGGNWIFLVHRQELLRQTRASLEESLNRKVGAYYADEKVILPVTVVMVQSAANHYKEGYEDLHAFIKSCTGLIGDEIHHLESEQWFEVISQITAPYRFGLSATPELEAEGMSLQALTGDIIVDIPVSVGLERGVLVPPRIWLLTSNQTTSKSTNWQTVYKELIVDNTERNLKAVEVFKQFKKEKKPTLGLVRQIKHGKDMQLRLETEGVNAFWIDAKVKPKDRDKAVLDLTNGKLDVIIGQSSIFSEGIDMPKLRAVVNLIGNGGDSDGDGNRGIIQIVGRGLRQTEGKTYFDYVDFRDYGHKLTRKAFDHRLLTLEKQGYSQFIKDWSEYEP